MEAMNVSSVVDSSVSSGVNGVESHEVEVVKVVDMRDNMEKLASVMSELAGYSQLKELLGALPVEAWKHLRKEVNKLHKVAVEGDSEDSGDDEENKAASKLFGPAVQPGLTRFAIQFNNTFKSGMYDLVDRSSARGPTGKVVLTLADVQDKDNTITLNSKDHSHLVAECFARRMPVVKK